MKKQTQQPKTKQVMTRRKFAATTGAAVAGFTLVPSHVLGLGGRVAPNSRINTAFIGVGSQGLRVMLLFLGQPDVQAVAVCDPMKSSATYHQWGQNEFRNGVRNLLKTDTGWDWLSPNSPMLPLTPQLSVPAGVCGREPARKIVDACNGLSKRSGESRDCAAYSDFRELLEKVKDLDAVVIGTTDVLHAPVAIAAMKLGKHVFCQKPMAHSLPAARLMADVARQTGVVTQVAVGPQASEETRRLREWLMAGAIGSVRHVMNWSNRPVWPQGLDRPKETPPVPEGFDWDLWLGPAPVRPYHPIYLPFVWRGWKDFGCGALGDMGCYSLDVIYRALNLGAPIAAEGSSSERFSDSFPKASLVHLDFAARDGQPPVRLDWYDGGLKPARPVEFEGDGPLPAEGLLFLGDQGTLLCDFTGEHPRLIPDSKMKAFKEPPKTLPRSPGNEREWLNAIKDEKATTGAPFEFSAKVTEALLLGNLAVRAGERVRWDSASQRLEGSKAAQELLNPQYRSGWGV
jgi:predicted dehydrogenase